MAQDYDILLFGVTGFTGKLALEHLLEKNYPNLRFGCCARNESKAQQVITAVVARLAARLGKPEAEIRALAPSKIEIADLVCKTDADEAALRAVVAKAKCCITSAGPFEKYGTTLVKLCAELGVHYADITGESDFFRMMIERHDETARKSGAVIVPHCGNDCIPWDLSVLEMSKYAASKGCELTSASTYTEVPPGTAMSGGTLTTAIYQLGKARAKSAATFDPLLRGADGTKSAFAQKNVSPKQDVYCAEFGRNGGPWIMAPVMANCVRRSNALLGYHATFHYGDCLLRDPRWSQWVKDKCYGGLVAAAIYAPGLFQRFLPQPGEGPTRETMDAGWLVVHTRGTMRDKASGAETALASTFTFNEDVTYLSTARFLVEAGRMLIEKPAGGGGAAGVVTPAVALGSPMIERLATQTGSKFELSEAAVKTVSKM